MPPVNVVAGLQSEFANKLALRPAIAFAKWMRCIQLAEEIRGAAGKNVGIEIGEMVLCREFLQNRPERRFEEPSVSEELAALRYVHRPKLSRPFVHVVEDVTMDRFEVLDIESARKWAIDQLGNALVRSPRFKACQ
jgi:hypothetical protein